MKDVVIVFQMWRFERLVGRANEWQARLYACSCQSRERGILLRALRNQAKPVANAYYSVVKGDEMKDHDTEKLDIEVKLKVEHLTLVARDRSVATRLKPNESSGARQSTFLVWIG
jgi:hypothetical protein